MISKRIEGLRPTQITVGLQEVAQKVSELRAILRWQPENHDASTENHVHEFLKKHVVPVVVGWRGNLFIIDHHHLCRAAHDCGISHVYTEQRADYSEHDKKEFWRIMELHHYVHPLDEHGVRHTVDYLPGHVSGLIDDPYRSLAGLARKVGAFDKTTEPFAEFRWADLYRRVIAIEDVRQDFDKALERAIKIAASDLAIGLPGYKG